ncbi:MAG: acetolactate synthase small subunit [Clostridiales bacterium]|jgi:acetolactate synthase-1/3 small subunit|nr:acetolactate synthase small subunit [Clostridiales bacterium]
MKRTISILVENHAGVLSRISGLFSRRGFNIDSLAVGVTDDPSISRITIVADGNEYTLEQLEKQLNKLIEVIKVKTLENDELLARELMLVKIVAPSEKRSEIATIVDIMGAKIIDLSLTTMTLEISNTSFHLARFEELIKPYGIIEMVRTGTIAIQKGADSISVKKQ